MLPLEMLRESSLGHCGKPYKISDGNGNENVSTTQALNCFDMCWAIQPSPPFVISILTLIINSKRVFESQGFGMYQDV